MLPAHDEVFLKGLGYAYEVRAESNEDLVVIKDVELHERYKPARANILIRVPVKYPAVKLDMFFLSPDVKFADGRACDRTTAVIIVGEHWQQWSRHLSESQWRPDKDCLETYWFGVIWKELIQ